MAWGGGLLFLPSAFLLVEVVAGLAHRRHPLRKGALSNAVLLMPSHDEESEIDQTLIRLAPTLCPEIRVIVIADNCHDDTAAIARRHEVEVWEREEPSLLGKPYALDWAIKRLAEDPPQVVVVLDADSWFGQGTPMDLAQAANSYGRPVQGVYRMIGGNLRGFAFRFRNEARLRGLAAWGAPVQITGSGFAIPWQLLQANPVPIGELAEDVIWGWRMTCKGIGPQLIPEVEVISRLPESKTGTRTQQRRWEHGILSATIRFLPRLLLSALWPPRLRRCLHLLDILVPPLALLLLAHIVLIGFGLAFTPLASLALVGLSLFFLTTAVFIGWWRYGKEDLPFRKLLTAPIYAVRKIGIYLSFLFRRQHRWNRTERDLD